MLVRPGLPSSSSTAESDEATARFAAQIAIACYQTARSLGNNPRTLADESQAAFSRALTLGTGTAQTRPEPPGSG